MMTSQVGGSSGRRCYLCNDPYHLAPDCELHKKPRPTPAQALEVKNEPVLSGASSEEAATCIVRELQDCCTLRRGTATLRSGHELSVLDLACGTQESNQRH